MLRPCQTDRFLVPVAGTSRLVPVNWCVRHGTGTSKILLPAAGTEIEHVLFLRRYSRYETRAVIGWSRCLQTEADVMERSDEKTFSLIALCMLI